MTVEVHFQGSKDSLNRHEEDDGRIVRPGKEISVAIAAGERLYVSCDADDTGGWVGMQSGFRINGERLESSKVRLEKGASLYVEDYKDVIAKVSHKPMRWNMVEEQLDRDPDYYSPENKDARHNIGQGNQDYSTKPGMTVFVNPEIRDWIVDRHKQAGYETPRTEPVAEGIEAIHYPDGVYLAARRGMNLWEHASPTYDRGGKNINLIAGFPYSDIIRVEGVTGEHWQNWDYREQAKLIEAYLAQHPKAPEVTP